MSTVNSVVLWLTEIFDTRTQLTWSKRKQGKESIYSASFEEGGHTYQITLTAVDADGITVHVEFDRDHQYHQTKDTTNPSTILSIIGHGVKDKLVDLGIQNEQNFTVLFTSADTDVDDMMSRARVYQSMMNFFARKFSSNRFWYKEIRRGSAVWHILSNRSDLTPKSDDLEFAEFLSSVFL